MHIIILVLIHSIVGTLRQLFTYVFLCMKEESVTSSSEDCTNLASVLVGCKTNSLCQTSEIPWKIQPCLQQLENNDKSILAHSYSVQTTEKFYFHIGETLFKYHIYLIIVYKAKRKKFIEAELYQLLSLFHS
jgi:hypothetical protein